MDFLIYTGKWWQVRECGHGRIEVVFVEYAIMMQMRLADLEYSAKRKRWGLFSCALVFIGRLMLRDYSLSRVSVNAGQDQTPILFC